MASTLFAVTSARALHRAKTDLEAEGVELRVMQSFNEDLSSAPSNAVYVAWYADDSYAASKSAAALRAYLVVMKRILGEYGLKANLSKSRLMSPDLRAGEMAGAAGAVADGGSAASGCAWDERDALCDLSTPVLDGGFGMAVVDVLDRVLGGVVALSTETENRVMKEVLLRKVDEVLTNLSLYKDLHPQHAVSALRFSGPFQLLQFHLSISPVKLQEESIDAIRRAEFEVARSGVLRSESSEMGRRMDAMHWALLSLPSVEGGLGITPVDTYGHEDLHDARIALLEAADTKDSARVKKLQDDAAAQKRNDAAALGAILRKHHSPFDSARRNAWAADWFAGGWVTGLSSHTMIDKGKGDVLASLALGLSLGVPVGPAQSVCNSAAGAHCAGRQLSQAQRGYMMDKGMVHPSSMLGPHNEHIFRGQCHVVRRHTAMLAGTREVQAERVPRKQCRLVLSEMAVGIYGPVHARKYGPDGSRNMRPGDLAVTRTDAHGGAKPVYIDVRVTGPLPEELRKATLTGQGGLVPAQRGAAIKLAGAGAKTVARLSRGRAEFLPMPFGVHGEAAVQVHQANILLATGIDEGCEDLPVLGAEITKVVLRRAQTRNLWQFAATRADEMIQHNRLVKWTSAQLEAADAANAKFVDAVVAAGIRGGGCEGVAAGSESACGARHL